MRFGGLFNKGRKDREFQDELESHIQMHTEDNLRSGMTPGEARRQAMIKLGGIESTKEAYREQRSLRWLENLVQDVRFGARQLRKNPGFTAVAASTLALCIGANLSIFAVVDAILIRSLPFPEAKKLVTIYNSYPKAGVDRDGASLTSYYERRGRISALPQMSAFRYKSATTGEPERLDRTARH